MEPAQARRVLVARRVEYADRLYAVLRRRGLSARRALAAVRIEIDDDTWSPGDVVARSRAMRRRQRLERVLRRG
jgi:hypothetical protein